MSAYSGMHSMTSLTSDVKDYRPPVVSLLKRPTKVLYRCLSPTLIVAILALIIRMS